MNLSLNQRNRKNVVPLPLFDWAEKRYRRTPVTIGGLWIEQRYRVRPSLADLVAELAGFQSEGRDG